MSTTTEITAAVSQDPRRKLSEREIALKARLEADIEENLKGFMKVGAALLIILDQELYRDDYDSFEDYCREEWDISRQHAYRLIEGRRVVDNLSPSSESLSPIGDSESGELYHFDVLPRNESQTRPLTAIPAEQQRAVWAMVLREAAASGANITAVLIQRCVDLFRQKKVAKSVHRSRQEGKTLGLPETLYRSYDNFLAELTRSNYEMESKGRMELKRMLLSILASLEK